MVVQVWIHMFLVGFLSGDGRSHHHRLGLREPQQFFQRCFYGALATGLALLTAAVSRSHIWRLTLLLITMAALAAYPLTGKSVAISLQSLLLILMLSQWWRNFADPRLWLYVLFGVVLTTGLGILLVGSGDPICHLFIGPCGSSSVISLGWVLRRSSMTS